MYPGGGGGHYLPDLAAAASGHGHYLSELAAPPGGHYMTGGAGGGEPFGGGQPGAPNATWQDLIQPRLPHIIKGKLARDCIIVFRHIPYFTFFQVGFEKLSCIMQINFVCINYNRKFLHSVKSEVMLYYQSSLIVCRRLLCIMNTVTVLGPLGKKGSSL